MDLATFRIQYPEFQTATDPLVSGKLAAAAQRLDAVIWGARFDQAHGLLTAHLLALSTHGQFARLQKDKDDTIYHKQYQELETQVCGLVFRVA